MSQYKAIQSLANATFDTREALEHALQGVLACGPEDIAYQRIATCISPYAPYLDFVFTRGQEGDYHFARFPHFGQQAREAIFRLSDYFSSVVGGLGYYSFSEGDWWITAEIVRTRRQDPVGRPIYEIRGQLHPWPDVGDQWYRFAVRRRSLTGRPRRRFRPGTYVATREVLDEFLRHCRQSDDPRSWAYGACRADADTSGLGFDVRFVAPELSRRGRRLMRMVRGAVRILSG